MKILPIHGTDLNASNVVLGMMRIAQLRDEEIRTLVAVARDNGVNSFDHADIYGGQRHACEQRFGDAISFGPAERESVLIQSKVGIRPGLYDFSKAHIVRTVEESLVALRTEYLDLLLLHRPDTLMEPDEVAEAFDELQGTGKVRNFGVSNHTPGQIELLRRSVRQPLVVNQVQLSLVHAPLIASGLATNMAHLDASIDRGSGILDHARMNRITLQAWSPFQSGFASGVFLGDREHYGPLNDEIDDLADAYRVPPAAIAVAWITRHPAEMQVVLGTTSPERVADAAAGSQVPLTREEWYRLFSAAGHTLP
ncbi:aldo/keto reductase family oxidoreductase [Occultella glacieicola]|uniref:Aldo/keto reductase family oxidoreductase n=1 Tax=Occultella glacieicola TaxID=2518684 RepID=A0ABY2E3P1_9MICO|nr:aldo/keto reductase [Occultella glacieicola]TDE92735.1 aldo/keto reductase family oxidoreductase [Occultella glacieicola]